MTRATPSTEPNPTATTDAIAAEELVNIYTQAANQTDDTRLRSFAAFSLGNDHYNDHRHLLRHADRNPTEERQRTLAHLRLPHIEAFIVTTDANNLRDLVEGMMAGLQRHVPRHESQFQAGTDDLIHLNRKPGSLAHHAINPSNYRIRFEEFITDFTQTNDPELRADTAFHIGALKIINERELRRFDYTNRLDRVMAGDARDDLEVIDQLIATADADQLREIVAGITSRIYIPKD